MKIGLAAYSFVNGDIQHNLSQVEKGLRAAGGRVDLLCFGESFLQGFDALSWRYEADRTVAVSADSPVMGELARLAGEYKTDLLLGYFERSGDSLYSSCAVFIDGRLAYNYRRISKGWKEYSITDEHYREGAETKGFLYQGRAEDPAGSVRRPVGLSRALFHRRPSHLACLCELYPGGMGRI